MNNVTLVTANERLLRVHIPTRNPRVNGAPARRCCVNFYTDGSVLCGRVGLSFYSCELGLDLGVTDHCSVFQAMVMAKGEVVVWLGRKILSTTFDSGHRYMPEL